MGLKKEFNKKKNMNFSFTLITAYLSSENFFVVVGGRVVIVLRT